MGLFGKIFGDKTETEPQASSSDDAAKAPAREEARKASKEGVGSSAKVDTTDAAHGRPARTAEARSLTKTPANDAAVAKPADGSRPKQDPAPPAAAPARETAGAGLPKPAGTSDRQAPKTPVEPRAKAATSGDPAPSPVEAAPAKPRSVALPDPASTTKDAPPAEQPAATAKRATAQQGKREPTGPTTAALPKAVKTATPASSGPTTAQPTQKAPETTGSAAGAAKPSLPDRDAQLRSLAERERTHMDHLKQFALDLELGCAPPKWASACRIPAAALSKGAKRLELSDVHEAAQELSAKLEVLARASNGHMDPDAREATLRAYATLATHTGDVPRGRPDVREREQLVLSALLHQVEGVHSLTFDKLREAGAFSLERLGTAPADELAAQTGVALELVERVTRQITELRSGQGRATAGEARQFLGRQAQSSLEELERAHERFLQAERDENAGAKRDARRQRDLQLWALSGLSARLGQLELAEELQRGSLAQRIERARALVSQWSE